MSKFKLKNLLSFVAVTFGIVTLFASSSILFGYSDVLKKEGNYPSFILWVNFFSGPLYLLAGAGLFYSKRWAFVLLLGIIILLMVSLSFMVLLLKIGVGYEMETVVALSIRIAVTSILAFFAFNKPLKT